MQLFCTRAIWCLQSSLACKINHCFDLSRNYQIFSAEENTRDFPNRSFILRSPCVHRSLKRSRLRLVCVLRSQTDHRLHIVHQIPFCVHIPFNLRSFMVCSSVAQRSLTVCSPLFRTHIIELFKKIRNKFWQLTSSSPYIYKYVKQIIEKRYNWKQLKTTIKCQLREST